MMTTIDGGRLLYGDWRRRRGTKTDAHLYEGYSSKPSMQPMGVDRRYPMCRKRIALSDTVAMVQGRPCTECLVAAITKRG